METHVHISAVQLIAVAAMVVVFFGTLHMLALSHDNRASRALFTLGF